MRHTYTTAKNCAIGAEPVNGACDHDLFDMELTMYVGPGKFSTPLCIYVHGL